MAYVVSAKGTYPPRFDWHPDWPVYRDKPVPEAIFFRQGYGLRITENEVPKRGVLTSTHKTLNDLICPTDNAVFVSSLLKSIWDRLAPGQVEFIPIEFVRKNKTRASDKDYYFINIPNQIEAIDYAKSNLVVEKGRTRFGYRYIKLPAGWGFGEVTLKLTVTSSARKGLNIWREWDSGDIASWIFVSDEVATEMKAEGCTGLEYMAVVEQ